MEMTAGRLKDRRRIARRLTPAAATPGHLPSASPLPTSSGRAAVDEDGARFCEIVLASRDVPRDRRGAQTVSLPETGPFRPPAFGTKRRRGIGPHPVAVRDRTALSAVRRGGPCR
ncbi:hypothetical protein [Rhodosalinus sp. K401]|uniref:hypothetical protein n=1 Tax=Rhodosalinus sp. K401 TaxID=3239195 RepID=UPI0035248D78